MYIFYYYHQITPEELDVLRADSTNSYNLKTEVSDL